MSMRRISCFFTLFSLLAFLTPVDFSDFLSSSESINSAAKSAFASGQKSFSSSLSKKSWRTDGTILIHCCHSLISLPSDFILSEDQYIQNIRIIASNSIRAPPVV